MALLSATFVFCTGVPSERQPLPWGGGCGIDLHVNFYSRLGNCYCLVIIGEEQPTNDVPTHTISWVVAAGVAAGADALGYFRPSSQLPTPTPPRRRPRPTSWTSEDTPTPNLVFVNLSSQVIAEYIFKRACIPHGRHGLVSAYQKRHNGVVPSPS